MKRARTATAVKTLKVIKGNKYEFYFSFPLAFVGLWNSAWRPMDLTNTLMMAGAALMAWLCSLNAVLDHRRMNWLEYSLALVWFAVLLFFTPLVLWYAFTMDFGGY